MARIATSAASEREHADLTAVVEEAAVAGVEHLASDGRRAGHVERVVVSRSPNDSAPPRNRTQRAQVRSALRKVAHLVC